MGAAARHGLTGERLRTMTTRVSKSHQLDLDAIEANGPVRCDECGPVITDLIAEVRRLREESDRKTKMYKDVSDADDNTIYELEADNQRLRYALEYLGDCGDKTTSNFARAALNPGDGE